MGYRIYIDEIGNESLKNFDADTDNRYFAIVGIILKEDNVNEFHHNLEKLKRENFGFDADNIFSLHKKEIVSKKGPFSVLLDENKNLKWENELCQFLSSEEYTIIGVAIDKSKHKSNYQEMAQNPYALCFKIMLERYQCFLNNKNSTGTIYIEKSTNNIKSILEKMLVDVKESGTYYIPAELFQKTLVGKDICFKNKSDNIAGLQVVDIIARAVFREIIGDIIPNGFNKRICDSVREKYFKMYGRIKGYGLKLI